MEASPLAALRYEAAAPQRSERLRLAATSTGLWCSPNELGNYRRRRNKGYREERVQHSMENMMEE